MSPAAIVPAVIAIGLLLSVGACGRNEPQAAVDTPAPAVPAVPASTVTASEAAGQTLQPQGQADRLPPPTVPPVTRDGVVYSQAGDGRDVGMAQVGGVLVATRAGGGERLWTLAVYPNPVDPAKESDAQWVFFQSMAFDAQGRLRIVSEVGEAYLVDVARRTVQRAP